MTEPQIADRLRALQPQLDDSNWGDVVERAAALGEPLPALSDARPRRRRVTAFALACTALAAALAVAPAWFSRGDDLSLVDRALAGVSDGPVLHVVLRTPAAAFFASAGGRQPHFSVVDLETGRERTIELTREIWYDSDRHLLHEVASIDGAVRSDALLGRADWDDAESRPSQPLVDPALAAFLTGYRQALEEGRAMSLGSNVVDGRTVEWLRFSSADGRWYSEVALEQDSERPLVLRIRCPSCDPPARERMYTVVELEGIPRDAADFTESAKQAREIAPYGDGGGRTISLSEANELLGQTALWAGPRVGEVEFSLVQYRWASRNTGSPPTEENRVGSVRGLVFIYGADVEADGRHYRIVPGRKSLSINQAPDHRYGPGNFDPEGGGPPLTLALAPVPPEGEVALSNPGFDDRWVAQLKRDGLYVEVQATSRELALAAARALRPVLP